MNVSMRDSFNLGWKLAAVLRGQACPEILQTYSAERQAVAKELIDFDREWAQVLSRGTDPDDGGSESPGPESGAADESAPAFQRYFVDSGRYTAGVGITYGPSLVCAPPTHQHLAIGFEVGARFHSAPVVRLGDAKPMHLGHTVKADGRWRLFAFAGKGDAAEDGSPMQALCEYLVDDPASPTHRYTPAGADPDAVIDLRAVFHQSHRDVAIERMPPILVPAKGRYGLLDYEKVFCRDPRPGNDIYELRGVDEQGGCLIIVRPDQHVAHVLPLDARAALAAFFDGFMRRVE
jgi:phenol 2-monooxygenase